MKKILFLMLFCSIFVLGCSNGKEEVENVSFDEVVTEENGQQQDEFDNNDSVNEEESNSNEEVNRLSNEAMKEYENKNFEKAKELYTEAIQLNAKNAGLYADRGRVKRDIGDLEGALEDVNKALELGDEAWIYAERAVVYRVIGDDDKSLKDFKKALSLDPNMDWVKESIKEMEGK